MKLIAFICIILISVLLAIVIVSYFDKCRKLKKRLRTLGIADDKLKGSRRAFNIGYLRDTLYERETELVSRDIDNI
jgi:hypothetical protein